jgi:drug/metabolite transporter (DMT)-like permease
LSRCRHRRRSFPGTKDSTVTSRSPRRRRADLIGGTIGQLDKIPQQSASAGDVYVLLATLVAGALAMLIGPLFNTFYPRFSTLVAAGSDTDLRDLYHLGAQVVTTLIALATLVVIFFARDLIAFWTRNADTAAHGADRGVFTPGQ